MAAEERAGRVKGIGDFVPTLAEVEALRRGKPLTKPEPRALSKPKADKAKADKGKAFRDEVWARDGGKSRATGKPLVRSGSINPDELGEVDHVINRSTAPERIYDTSNGILLSKRENRLKKAVCPRAPEHHLFEVDGPDNRALPQRFIWRDGDGKIIRKTEG